MRRSAAARARSASAGSTGRCPRGAARAAVLRGPLGARTVIPSATIRRASRLRASSSGKREHRAGVALGQLAAGEHPEHLLRQLEQPQPVRDARLGAADALGDLAERELELVDQRRRRRAPPRRATGSRGRRSRRARGAASRGRPRPGRAPGASRARPRAPRASGARRRRARSRPAARGRTTTGWSTPWCRSDAASPAVASGSNRRRGWRGFGVDRLDRQVEQLRLSRPRRRRGPRGRGRGRGGASSGALDKLHRHLPVGLRAGRAAVVGDRGEPVARRLGEAHRAGHGRGEDEVAEVASGARARPRPRAACARRPSSAGSRRRRARGLSRALDEVDRAEELREALERVVLRLHGHEHAVGGGERVDGQRAERRRAVEEDEAVRLASRRRERVGEVPLAALERREVDASPPRARPSPGRGRGSGTRSGSRARGAGRRRAGRGSSGRSRASSEARRRVRLRVEIDEQARARPPRRGRRRG